MDVTDIEPKILNVELPPESFASYRAINTEDGDDGSRYAVLLTVSVGIDEFIDRELERGDGNNDYPKYFETNSQDRMRIAILNTTLYEVRDRLDELTGWLRSAVHRAAEARRAASLEDDQLQALEDTINNMLEG